VGSIEEENLMIRATLATLALAATLTGAAAAQNPTTPPKPANANLASHKPPMHKVREAQPGLLKQAKITATAAEETALTAVPGGKVTSREIERKKGALVYAFHIKTDGTEGYQAVTVDATNGTVLSNEHANPMKKAAKPDTAKRKPPQQ
jgi:uncharacterized membrane protein YkoI